MHRSISVDADEFYSRNEVETSGKKKEALQNGKKKKNASATGQRDLGTFTAIVWFPHQ